jgi:hypothetical protein
MRTPTGIGAMAPERWPRCGRQLYLLRLGEYWSIRAGMQTVMHDITALLAMARRQPQSKPC